MLSPNESVNCVIHESADMPVALVAMDNKLIEPDMINEGSVADPVCCPARILCLWNDGEDDARL